MAKVEEQEGSTTKVQPQYIRHIVVDNCNVKLIFFDTLGMEAQSNSITISMYRNTDLCFLVYKMQDVSTYNSLSIWKKFIVNNSR